MDCMNEIDAKPNIANEGSESAVDPKDISIHDAYNIKLTESAEELIADLRSPK